MDLLVLKVRKEIKVKKEQLVLKVVLQEIVELLLEHQDLVHIPPNLGAKLS